MPPGFRRRGKVAALGFHGVVWFVERDEERVGSLGGVGVRLKTYIVGGGLILVVGSRMINGQDLSLG